MIDSVAYETEGATLQALYDAGSANGVVLPTVSIWSDDTGNGNNSTGVIGTPTILDAGWAKKLVLVAGDTLPDASGADVGTGFTVTGLFWDGTHLLANSAGNNASDLNTRAQRIVVLDRDATTIIREIDIRTIFGLADGSTGTVQGLTGRADGTKYIAGQGINRIYILDPDETDGGFISFTSPNGLAYNDALDNLYVSDFGANSSVYRINLSGTTQATIDLSGIVGASKRIDGLYYDQADNLYVTLGGDDHAGQLGTVVQIDISTEGSPSEVRRWVRSEWDAMEHIAFSSPTRMHVSCDGGLKQTTMGENVVFSYDIEDMPAAVDFSGTGEAVRFLETSYTMNPSNNDPIWIVIAAFADTAGTGDIFSKSLSAAQQMRLGASSSNSTFFRYGVGTSSGVGTPGTYGLLMAGSSHVFSGRSDGSEHIAGIDSNEDPTPATSGTQTTTELVQLGGYSNGSGGTQNNFDGKIMRVYVFTGEPTADDIEKVEGEAARLVGANGALPFGHAHRFAPVVEASGGFRTRNVRSWRTTR